MRRGASGHRLPRTRTGGDGWFERPGEAPRASGGWEAGDVAPPDCGTSAATAHEAPLALHELQVLKLLDEQCRPDQGQPGPLDELVEAGWPPAECAEHSTLLVTEW